MFKIFGITIGGNKKKSTVRRVRIQPHTLTDRGYVPVSPGDLQVNETVVGAVRVRETRYHGVLADFIEDVGHRILSDDDLEEAAYLLVQYMSSRGYKLVGNAQQVLAKLHEHAEKG